MKKNNIIVLESTVSDGFLCKTGDGNYVVSTEYHNGQRYDDLVKTFESKEDANEFIKNNGFYALQTLEVNKKDLY